MTKYMQIHSRNMDTNIKANKPSPVYQTHEFIIFAIDHQVQKAYLVERFSFCHFWIAYSTLKLLKRSFCST